MPDSVVKRGEERARRVTGKKATHKSGKTTGYTESDGKFFVAPCHKDSFAKIRAEREALHELLQMTNAYVSARLQAVREAEIRTFDYVLDDLGKTYTEANWYYHSDGYLYAKPKGEEPSS